MALFLTVDELQIENNKWNPPHVSRWRRPLRPTARSCSSCRRGCSRSTRTSWWRSSWSTGRRSRSCRCELFKEWFEVLTVLLDRTTLSVYDAGVQTDLFLLPKAQLDEYIRRLEETEWSLRTAEAKIAERDERILEVERLLDCMGKVKKLHLRLEDEKNKCLSANTLYLYLYFAGERSTPEEVAGRRTAPPSAGAHRHHWWHRSKEVQWGAPVWHHFLWHHSLHQLMRLCSQHCIDFYFESLCIVLLWDSSVLILVLGVYSHLGIKHSTGTCKITQYHNTHWSCVCIYMTIFSDFLTAVG